MTPSPYLWPKHFPTPVIVSPILSQLYIAPLAWDHCKNYNCVAYTNLCDKHIKT